jgi:hypothetical protein
MTQTEALRLALEALQNPWKAGPDGVADAITAIKAALEAPQRTWVGLTDEDEIDWDGGDLKSLIKAIEKALKERNT